MIAVAQGQVAGNLKRRFPCCAQGGQGRGGRGSAGFSGRLWPTRHQKRSWNQARRPAASIDAASQAAFTRTPREGSRPLPDAYRSRIPAQCGRACDAGRPGGRYGRTGCWTRRSTPPSAPPPTGCHSPGLSTSSTASYSRTVKAQPVEYSELARPRAGAIRLIGLCGSPVLSARKRLFCLRHQGSWETSRVRMSMFTSASFAVTWPGYSLWPTRRCCRTSRRKHGGPETLCRWRACLPSFSDGAPIFDPSLSITSPLERQPSFGTRSTLTAGEALGQSRSSGYTCRRCTARALSIRARVSASISLCVRQRVGQKATGPSTGRWCSGRRMSRMQSRPT